MKIVCARLDQENARYVFFSKEKELPELNPSNVVIEVKYCKLLDIHSDIIKELFLKCPHSDIPAALEVTGVVTETGTSVTSLQCGERVTGFIPITSEWSGCAEYCVLGEYDVVKLPEDIDYLSAVSVLGDALHVYTALQYMGKLNVGDTILILEGAVTWARLAMQLAFLWGAKAITVVPTLDEKSALEKLAPPPNNVIVTDVTTLVSHVMEETGGLGVDIIIDNGVRLFPHEDDLDAETNKDQIPSKHDIISMLAVGGRWVTSCPHLQLDPPDCDQLLLRCATVSFLFSQTWLLCPSRHGKLQHILRDFFNKLSEKKLKIAQAKYIGFKELLNSLESDHNIQPGTLIKM